MIKFLFPIFILLGGLHVYGQNADSSRVYQIEGIVRDSAFNHVLEAATIALYTAGEKNLIQYQISNKIGYFQLKFPSPQQDFSLVFTFIGYKSLEIPIDFDGKNSRLNIGTVNMIRNDSSAEEVVIYGKAPVRLNKDTLEFNADAFKLDQNAVLEDLLRRLNGITIWGDGVITVNGKEINNLLVNGKPFFGKDLRIATQNIPKAEIESVQVYKTVKQSNPLDSTPEINVKLKKESSFRGFGQAATGYGNRSRYDHQMTLNHFRKNHQLSLVAGKNNLNKTPENIEQVLLNSTYKGLTPEVNYAPNFQLPSIHRPFYTGVSLQFDVNKSNSIEEKSEVNLESFYKHDPQNRIKNYTSIFRLTADSTLIDDQKSIGERINTTNMSQAGFNQKNKNSNFSLAAEALIQNVVGQNLDSTFKINRIYEDTLSGFLSLNEYNTQSQKLKLSSTYDHQSSPKNKEKLWSNFSIGADLSLFQNQSKDQYFNRFQNYAANISNNTRVIYEKKEKTVNAHFFLIKKNIFSVVRKNTSGLPIVDFQVSSYLENSTSNQLVLQEKGWVGLIEDGYLTNNLSYLENTTRISLPASSNYYIKKLANRYTKSISYKISPEIQFFRLGSESIKQFQKLDKRFTHFLPSANITYINEQFGLFSKELMLEFKSNISYPKINQWAPLIDSNLIQNIFIGNVDLQPVYLNTINFRYKNNLQTVGKALFYEILLHAQFPKNDIVEDVSFNDAGNRTTTIFNTTGNNMQFLSITVRKSFKVKQNLFTLQANSKGIRDIRFAKLNSNPVKYRANRFTSSIYLTYSFTDRFSGSVESSIASSRNIQNEDPSKIFYNNNLSNKIFIGFLLNKNIRITSSLNNNRFSLNKNTLVDFTLFNSSIAYRFGKSKNLEFCLQAYDLLRQNKAIQLFNSDNFLGTEENNVLQRTLVASFIWYPKIKSLAKTKS